MRLRPLSLLGALEARLRVSATASVQSREPRGPARAGRGGRRAHHRGRMAGRARRALPERGGRPPAARANGPWWRWWAWPPGCGATAVARALGARLAARDDDGAYAVTATSAGIGAPRASGRRPVGALARSPAWRPYPGLRPAVYRGVRRPRRAGRSGALPGAVGARRGRPERGAGRHRARGLGDPGRHATGRACPREHDDEEWLPSVGPEPITVLNRALGDDGPWTGRAGVELPESRMGARLRPRPGREPRGDARPGARELQPGRAWSMMGAPTRRRARWT